MLCVNVKSNDRSVPKILKWLCDGVNGIAKCHERISKYIANDVHIPGIPNHDAPDTEASKRQTIP